MTDFDPQVAEALTRLVERLREEAPELVAVMDEAKAGRCSQEEALGRLMRLVQEDPRLSALLLDETYDATGSLRDPEQGLTITTDPPLPGGEVFQAGVGLPQLNPLVEAAIIERVQFDDDAPELRSGPIPEGVSPALPVATKARNPVALGSMLKQASAEVAEAVEEHEATRRAHLERVASTKETGLIRRGPEGLAKVDPDFHAEVQGTAETDLDTYRRGEVPAPVEVATPSGAALAQMTPAERKDQAWRFLSTTQGRRTAVGTIQDLILVDLEKQGLRVVGQEYDPQSSAEPVAFHEWTVNLGERGSAQPAFSLIDVAAKVLARALGGQAAERGGESPLALEVIPVNTVDIRSVGWGARLVEA